MSQYATEIAISLFVIAASAFLWWRTNLFSDLRAWRKRDQAVRTYGYDLKALDGLLWDRVRLVGEVIENDLAMSRFVEKPVRTADEIQKTLDMLEAAREHLLRLAAQVGLGEESVLVPKRSAPVIPLKDGPRQVWRENKLVPKERS